ncbi:MAG: radical SAM protein [Candidatus Hodarchaeales archaeon]
MKNTICPYLWNNFTLDHHGNVFSCCHIKPVNFGNIYISKLSELTNSNEIVKYRKLSMKGYLDCYENCNLIVKDEKNDNCSLSPYTNYYKMREIHIHFGNRCNINCIMCKHPKKYLQDPSILDEKILIKNIDIAPFQNVVIQGGEPLYIQNCLNYLTYLGKIKKKYILLTNGLLIDRTIANILAKNAKTVSISINAYSKDTHEKVNAGSNFDRLIENIKELKKAKEKNRTECKINGRFTINPIAVKEIPLFIKFYHELGFDCINFGYDAKTVPIFLTKHPKLKLMVERQIKEVLKESNPNEVDLHRLKLLGLL